MPRVSSTRILLVAFIWNCVKPEAYGGRMTFV
jgi:hypothetical protein